MPVVAVGDVRQSIYRFRGARPELFTARSDSAQAAGTAVRLTRTFRHPADLALAFNALFATTIDSAGVPPPNAVSTKDPHTVARAPLTIALVEKGGNAEESRLREAEAVVGELLRLRGTEDLPTPWSQLAVLLPVRTSLPAITPRPGAAPHPLHGGRRKWTGQHRRGARPTRGHAVGGQRPPDRPGSRVDLPLVRQADHRPARPPNRTPATCPGRKPRPGRATAGRSPAGRSCGRAGGSWRRLQRAMRPWRSSGSSESTHGCGRSRSSMPTSPTTCPRAPATSSARQWPPRRPGPASPTTSET